MATVATGRLLVVQPGPTSPSGYLVARASARGLVVDVHRPYQGDPLPADVDGFDALVVLGGSVGVYDDPHHPWLTPLKSLLALAVLGERPTLGIGLGHQLLTVALGGRVGLNPHGPSRGLVPVDLAPAAAIDRLLRSFRRGTRWVHWNDYVTLAAPVGALPLAHAADGTLSAIRYGSSAWGLQSNPLATAEDFEDWCSTLVTPRWPDGTDLAERAREIRAIEARLIREREDFLSAFLTLAPLRARR